MKIRKKISKFFRYEGKLLLISLILILIVGCISWRTFFYTAPQTEIRKDYMIEDIVSTIQIYPERLEKYDSTQLEMISRLELDGLIAIEKYPNASKRIYGELKEFQLFYDIVNEFGPHHIIPVLDFYYEEGNLALDLEDKLAKWISELFDKPVDNDSLSDRQKRLLAIMNEIQYQKHNFLARFVFTEDGAKRNYVSSTTSTIMNFLTGGLANFNEAVVIKGISKVSTEELIDAGIDVLVLIPFAAFFSRTSKTAATAMKGGRTAVLAERSAIREGAGVAMKTSRFSKLTRATTSVLRTIPVRTLFKFKYVKWYILGLAIAKPSLINHAASLLAKAVSIPPVVMKTSFWFLIFFPLLNLIVPLLLFFRFLWRKIKRTRPAPAVS